MNSSYDLSLEEQKILLTLASMVQLGGEKFKPYIFKINDFIKLLEVKNQAKYTEIPKIIKKLKEKVFEIKEENKTIQIAWLSSAAYEEGTRCVKLEFSPKLKPYILKIKGPFTQYKLANILNMKSKYSPRIYEILKCNKFKKQGFFEIKITNLRRLLKAEDIYPKYNDFKRKVIEKSQKELSKLSDISFDFEDIKTGRKVTGIKFHIRSKDKKQLLMNYNNQRPNFKKIKLLKRERINYILSAIYYYPLTIIEAPIGFGKTTAVKQFLASKNNPYFWITFSDLNKTASFFWSNFSNEISKIDEDAGQKLKCLGFPVGTPQILKVLSILDDIDYDEETVFVIDDYYLLEEIQVNKLLRHIVLEKLDNFHIVIITRDTTKIDFTELLSKGFCQVISQQQLKFTYEEIEKYCLMMDRNISSSDLQKIKEYTDGWISLAYMVILGLDKGIPVGMNNTIEDLIENVLFSTYDEYIQNFLLELSIMDNFTAEQARFVTHEEEADKILKKLRQENAFVFYDEVNKTYKIHNVLLDFLRIKQHFEPGQVKELYRRLGYWYLNRKEFVIAYGYLNRAGDVEKILSVLNNPDNVSSHLTEFEGSFEMFNDVPEELLYKYPIAYLQHIFLSILKGDNETIEKYLKKLDKLISFYENIKDIEQEYKNRIIAEALIVKKFTRFNDIEQMGINNDKIIKLLDGKSSYIMLRENGFTFGSPHLLYTYFRDEGTLNKVRDIFSNKELAHPKISNGCGTGSEYIAKAEYALETCNIKEAELNSIKAVYKAKTKSQASIIICAYFNLIRTYIFQGSITEGIDKLEELDSYISNVNSHICNTAVDLCKGYVYACLNQYEKIPYWLQIGDMGKAYFFYEGMGFNCIVYGKAVMLSKNYAKLEMLTESFVEYFSMFSFRLGFIHNGIFKAVAKYHLYGEKEGVLELQDTLLKAQADNIIMPFAENAAHIMDMLTIIENNNLNNEYIKKVVLFSKKYKISLDNNKLDEVRLSHREIEVLSLISKGLKRDEVACNLMISNGTVKTHLQNIYKKLGVSGKVSAIKAAQMHGII